MFVAIDLLTLGSGDMRDLRAVDPGSRVGVHRSIGQMRRLGGEPCRIGGRSALGRLFFQRGRLLAPVLDPQQPMVGVRLRIGMVGQRKDEPGRELDRVGLARACGGINPMRLQRMIVERLACIGRLVAAWILVKLVAALRPIRHPFNRLLALVVGGVLEAVIRCHPVRGPKPLDLRELRYPGPFHRTAGRGVVGELRRGLQHRHRLRCIGDDHPVPIG
ncbi:hypothetical protein D9M70_451830 [compost metagenome]